MKYTIVHVNDRAKTNMDQNKNILKDFEYINDIKYYNGNEIDCKQILIEKGINTECWQPYDGRNTQPIPGEYGFMASTLSYFEYMVNNDIDQLLMIEDDIMLKKDFVENLNLCIDELPKDFDFLSLYYFELHNNLDETTDIGLKYIHKSNNEYSGTQAMVYSLSCAKKFLKICKRQGFEYTADCMMYKFVKENTLKGYSIKKDNLKFLEHDYKNIKSLIDPENFRSVDDM